MKPMQLFELKPKHNNPEDLVRSLHAARSAVDACRHDLDAAKEAAAHWEKQLIDCLEASSKSASEPVEGIGVARIKTGSISATCSIDDMPKAVVLFRSQNRPGIREVVTTSALSSYARELVLANKDIPDFLRVTVTKKVVVDAL